MYRMANPQHRERGRIYSMWRMTLLRATLSSELRRTTRSNLYATIEGLKNTRGSSSRKNPVTLKRMCTYLLDHQAVEKVNGVPIKPQKWEMSTTNPVLNGGITTMENIQSYSMTSMDGSSTTSCSRFSTVTLTKSL